MPYDTISDMIDRFTEAEMIDLTDTTSSGLVDASRIERALVDADAEVEAALRGRYALPVTPVPELLVRIACDMARYATDFLTTLLQMKKPGRSGLFPC